MVRKMNTKRYTNKSKVEVGYVITNPMLETYKEMIEDCFLEINETRKENEISKNNLEK